MDCMTSLRMIYLKKLSTGHDEHRQHMKQLEELLNKIKRYEETKKKQQQELKDLRAKKEEYRIEQNQIKGKLDKELNGVKERKDATKKKLQEDCRRELELEKKNHEDLVRSVTS